MGITYKKLRRILFEKEITLKEIREKTKIGNEALAKISKDEYISMASLEKIARYLNVDIGDIVNNK